MKTDPENIITYINQKFSELSGYRDNELIGRNCRSFRDRSHSTNHDCEDIAYELS
jgi:PAS domain S-box-containing protein